MKNLHKIIANSYFYKGKRQYLNLMNINILMKYMFFCLFLLLLFITPQAQDTIIRGNVYEDQYIKWIGQYPLLDQNKKGKKFSEKFSEIVFGKKQPELIKPVSVFALNPDSLWIIDQGNGIILEIKDKKGEVPRVFHENPGYFLSLLGVCSIADNRILFTDSHLNNIFLLSGNSKEIKVLNDSLVLQQPTGIAYSKKNDEIWVVETAAHRISVLDSEGKPKRKIGNRGVGPGEFNFPTFIWIDNQGTIYIVDSMNFRIQIFDSRGNFQSSFGESGDASGYFARPKGIATDSNGNIYIADGLYHTVQIFNKKGEILYNFGAQGRDKGEFWMPTGLFIDHENYIYVADSYNSRVQIFQLVKNN
ncbi:6-bladed beta-propeller [Bacteroidota bacterium]